MSKEKNRWQIPSKACKTLGIVLSTLWHNSKLRQYVREKPVYVWDYDTEKFERVTDQTIKVINIAEIREKISWKLYGNKYVPRHFKDD